MKYFRYFHLKLPLYQQVRHQQCCSCSKPKHLICFKNWTECMVLEIINSAMNLKCRLQDTHQKKIEVLQNCKVMILQEVNEPVLNMAVSKAASLLGAQDVNITDHLIWEHDYLGRVFSYMADAIFVSTATHMCVQRFAEQASVPVMCMRSRTHASIQALATVMGIVEEFGTMKCVNVSYLGSPHPVLNSYLLLCPMLGANIKFKCCCDFVTQVVIINGYRWRYKNSLNHAVEISYVIMTLCNKFSFDKTLLHRIISIKCPVSPLLLKASEDMTSRTQTESKECKEKEELLRDTSIIIAGPTHAKKHDEFKISLEDIQSCTQRPWVFFHTCPRGEEVDDDLFLHCNARTFSAFENMHFIAAALMANAIKGHTFKGAFCSC